MYFVGKDFWCLTRRGRKYGGMISVKAMVGEMMRACERLVTQEQGLLVYTDDHRLIQPGQQARTKNCQMTSNPLFPRSRPEKNWDIKNLYQNFQSLETLLPQ